MTESSHDLETGTILDGKYEILAFIGCGGMGSVYRARHLEIGNQVAIKVMHPRFAADPESVKRFQREARIIASLRHTNILSVYAFGAVQGLIYMAMELVEGVSLGQLIEEKGTLPPAQALPILMQICQAMKFAHAHDVLHRDLKPDNIITVGQDRSASDNNCFNVKVVDFGLAKLLDGSDGRLTKTGEVVGDPSYMSPEQCQGKPLDKRTDIYSFGCLMYETFAGLPPFREESPVATLFKQVSENPPPFARRLSLPEALEGITMTAMAKQPGDRYDSFEAVEAALNQFLVNPDSRVTAPRATIAGARRPVLTTTLLCVAALLLISIPVLMVMPVWQPSDAALEELSPEQLIAQADIAADAHQNEEACVYLKRALTVANPTPARQKEVCKRLCDLYSKMQDHGQELTYRRLCAELSHRLGAPTAEKRDAYHFLGRCYCELERYPEAVDALEKALYFGDNFDTTKVYFGQALFFSGRYFALSPEAVKRLDPKKPIDRDLGACYVLKEVLPRLENNDKLMALDTLAASLLKLERYNEAQLVAKQMQPMNSLQADHRLATILIARGDLEAAKKLSSELLKTPKVGSYPRIFLGSACNLGLIAYRQGKYKEAATHFDNAGAYLVKALPSASDPVATRRCFEYLLCVQHARDVARQRAGQEK